MADNKDMKQRLANADGALVTAYSKAVEDAIEGLSEADVKALRKDRSVARCKQGDKPPTGARVTLAEDLFKGTPFEGITGLVTPTPEWARDLGAGKNAAIVDFGRIVVGRHRHFIVRPGFISNVEIPEVDAESTEAEDDEQKASEEAGSKATAAA